jgi:hypothetical protein
VEKADSVVQATEVHYRPKMRGFRAYLKTFLKSIQWEELKRPGMEKGISFVELNRFQQREEFQVWHQVDRQVLKKSLRTLISTKPNMEV